MEPRPDSPIYTRLVNPGFLGEPVVTGPADRAVRAREEHRTASEAFAIRFDAGRDRASRLRAFDHEHTHLQPPVFLSQQGVRSPIGWIAPPFAWGAHSNRSRPPFLYI